MAKNVSTKKTNFANNRPNTVKVRLSAREIKTLKKGA